MMFGLPNFHNNCFVNTAFQCLLSTRSFYSSLLKYDHFNIMNTLRIHHVNINHHKYKLLLKDISSKLSMNFEQQHDIHEFIILFIDFLNLQKQQNIQIQKSSSEIENLANEKWFSEYSDMLDLFYFQILTTIKCNHCNHIHYNIEKILTIDCHVEKNSCIKALVDKYFEQDSIPDWICDQCTKAHCKNVVRKTICKTPKIIIISLKKFNMSEMKIDINKNLDIAPIQHLPNIKTKYSLKSIGNHIGSSEYGHYFSTVFDQNMNMTMIDDMTISTKNSFNSRYAYILFYEYQ